MSSIPKDPEEELSLLHRNLESLISSKRFNPDMLIQILKGDLFTIGTDSKEPFQTLYAALNICGTHAERTVIAENLGQLMDMGLDNDLLWGLKPPSIPSREIQAKL